MPKPELAKTVRRLPFACRRRVSSRLEPNLGAAIWPDPAATARATDGEKRALSKARRNIAETMPPSDVEVESLGLIAADRKLNKTPPGTGLGTCQHVWPMEHGNIRR